MCLCAWNASIRGTVFPHTSIISAPASGWKSPNLSVQSVATLSNSDLIKWRSPSIVRRRTTTAAQLLCKNISWISRSASDLTPLSDIKSVMYNKPHLVPKYRWILTKLNVFGVYWTARVKSIINAKLCFKHHINELPQVTKSRSVILLQKQCMFSPLELQKANYSIKHSYAPCCLWISAAVTSSFKFTPPALGTCCCLISAREQKVCTLFAHSTIV